MKDVFSNLILRDVNVKEIALAYNVLQADQNTKKGDDMSPIKMILLLEKITSRMWAFYENDKVFWNFEHPKDISKYDGIIEDVVDDNIYVSTETKNLHQDTLYTMSDSTYDKIKSYYSQ